MISIFKMNVICEWYVLNRSIVDGSIIFSSEPFHGFLLGNSVLGSNGALASSSEANPASRPLQDDVEVHTEDTSEGVILDSQVDVLLNTESKASCIREVSFLQLSVLNLQTSLQDFVGFVSSDGHVNCNFLVPFDAKASNCESGSGGDWFLSWEIF